MSDWWVERRQDQELEELRSEMSLAASEASNLRSRVSQLQGSLDSRLQRLTAAFDAFVELSDIRYELIGFAAAAEVRRHAGQVLTALASAQQPPPPGPVFPGYWLQPAVAAIHGLSADTTKLPAGPLSEAMTLDERRTSIFLCLSLAALGRRDLVRTTWLETSFGTPAEGKVTRLQRALWSTAARGGLGADGQALIVERLQEHVKGLSWLETVESRADSQRPSGPAFDEVATARNARARLSRLRPAVDTIAGDTAVREPDRDLAYSEPDPDSPSAVLRMLISEGSEPEREPLARVAELRARITDTAAAAGAIAATGLVVAVGLGLMHPFWIVVGVVILAVAAHRFWQAREQAAEAKVDAADQIVRLKEKADEAAAELASYKSNARDREASIAADLEAIRKHLS